MISNTFPLNFRKCGKWNIHKKWAFGTYARWLHCTLVSIFCMKLFLWLKLWPISAIINYVKLDAVILRYVEANNYYDLMQFQRKCCSYYYRIKFIFLYASQKKKKFHCWIDSYPSLKDKKKNFCCIHFKSRLYKVIPSIFFQFTCGFFVFYLWIVDFLLRECADAL